MEYAITESSWTTHVTAVANHDVIPAQTVIRLQREVVDKTWSQKELINFMP